MCSVLLLLLLFFFIAGLFVKSTKLAPDYQYSHMSWPVFLFIFNILRRWITPYQGLVSTCTWLLLKATQVISVVVKVIFFFSVHALAAKMICDNDFVNLFVCYFLFVSFIYGLNFKLWFSYLESLASRGLYTVAKFPYILDQLWIQFKKKEMTCLENVKHCSLCSSYILEV